MSTDLGRVFYPVIAGVPPHMSTEDLPIYKRWAINGLQGALRQHFDVGVGFVDIPSGSFSENILKSWKRINQKRIDAVIEYEDHVKIVEFRHEVTPNAIGRLLTYEMLWKDEPGIDKPYKLLLVSNRYDKDVERLSKIVNILYQVV